MGLLNPLDALWLWAESAANPFHVMGLQLFRPPPGANEDFVARLYDRMTDPTWLKPEFRQRPRRSPLTAGQFAWHTDDEIDLTQHVQRIGLPPPGRIRELLTHVSTFHASCLDRHRPLWEAHLIEGLEDGRFALCTKVHHAMFDGVAVARHLLGGLSTNPTSQTCTPPWLTPFRDRDGARRPGTAPPTSSRSARALLDAPVSLARSGRTLTTTGLSAAVAGTRTLPFTAPASMLNVPVSGSRRFAGQAWPIARLRDVAKRAECSTNDVALAMCSGALRSYLDEHDALPASPLVAMVPVSLRSRSDDEAPRQGNNLSAILCPLATDLPTPEDRLQRIHDTMSREKSQLADLDPLTSSLVGIANMGGVLITAAPMLPSPPRPAYNVVVSNIPASRERLYLNGCQLEETYPVSVIFQGQALNITLVSYADQIAIGVTGCKRSVPRLQTLLTHLENALAELEGATHNAPTPSAR